MDHENIVNIINILPPIDGEWTDLYIVSELMDTDLHQIISSPQPLTDAHHRYFMYQLVRGVGYLHKHNIIHRDIKGANILVDDRGTVKLADFGASKRMSGTVTIGDKTQSLRGTPYFMAPEVILQNGSGRKADVWSVACTVIQMATGNVSALVSLYFLFLSSCILTDSYILSCNLFGLYRSRCYSLLGRR